MDATMFLFLERKINQNLKLHRTQGKDFLPVKRLYSQKIVKVSDENFPSGLKSNSQTTTNDFLCKCSSRDIIYSCVTFSLRISPQTAIFVLEFEQTVCWALSSVTKSNWAQYSTFSPAKFLSVNAAVFFFWEGNWNRIWSCAEFSVNVSRESNVFVLEYCKSV